MMGTISKDTFKKAFLLSVIGQFRESVYGRLRMHKVAFFAESALKVEKPFTYKFSHYGQYSEELESKLEELKDIGAINISKMNEITPTHYLDIPSDKSEIRELARTAMEKTNSDILPTIEEAVEKYGYLPEKTLLDEAYNHPLIRGKERGDLLIRENLPPEIKVDMDDEVIEDFELMLDPRFTVPMRELANGLKSVKLTPEAEKFLLDVSR